MAEIDRGFGAQMAEIHRGIGAQLAEVDRGFGAHLAQIGRGFGAQMAEIHRGIGAQLAEVDIGVWMVHGGEWCAVGRDPCGQRGPTANHPSSLSQSELPFQNVIKNILRETVEGWPSCLPHKLKQTTKRKTGGLRTKQLAFNKGSCAGCPFVSSDKNVCVLNETPVCLKSVNALGLLVS